MFLFQSQAQICWAQNGMGRLNCTEDIQTQSSRKSLLSDKDFYQTPLLADWEGGYLTFRLQPDTVFRPIYSKLLRNNFGISERYRCCDFFSITQNKLRIEVAKCELTWWGHNPRKLPSIAHAIRATATFFQRTSNCLHRNGSADAWKPNKWHPLLIWSMFVGILWDCWWVMQDSTLSAASK